MNQKDIIEREHAQRQLWRDDSWNENEKNVSKYEKKKRENIYKNQCEHTFENENKQNKMTH